MILLLAYRHRQNHARHDNNVTRETASTEAISIQPSSRRSNLREHRDSLQPGEALGASKAQMSSRTGSLNSHLDQTNIQRRFSPKRTKSCTTLRLLPFLLDPSHPWQILPHHQCPKSFRHKPENAGGATLSRITSGRRRRGRISRTSHSRRKIESRGRETILRPCEYSDGEADADLEHDEGSAAGGDESQPRSVRGERQSLGDHKMSGR